MFWLVFAVVCGPLLLPGTGLFVAGPDFRAVFDPGLIAKTQGVSVIRGRFLRDFLSFFCMAGESPLSTGNCRFCGLFGDGSDVSVKSPSRKFSSELEALFLAGENKAEIDAGSVGI